MKRFIESMFLFIIVGYAEAATSYISIENNIDCAIAAGQQRR